MKVRNCGIKVVVLVVLILFLIIIFSKTALGFNRDEYQFQMGIHKNFQSSILSRSENQQLTVQGEQLGTQLKISYNNPEKVYFASKGSYLAGEGKANYIPKKNEEYEGAVDQVSWNLEMDIGKELTSAFDWDFIPYFGLRVEEENTLFRFGAPKNSANADADDESEPKGSQIDLSQRQSLVVVGLIIRHDVSSTLSLGVEGTMGKVVLVENHKKGSATVATTTEASKEIDLKQYDISYRALLTAGIKLDRDNGFIFSPYFENRNEKNKDIQDGITENYGANLNYYHKF